MNDKIDLDLLFSSTKVKGKPEGVSVETSMIPVKVVMESEFIIKEEIFVKDVMEKILEITNKVQELNKRRDELAPKEMMKKSMLIARIQALLNLKVEKTGEL